MPAPHPPTLSRRSRRMLARRLGRRARRLDPPSAPEFRITKTRGAELVASILAAIRENAQTAPRKPSTKPAKTSKQRGECSLERDRSRFFKHGEISGNGQQKKYRRFDRHERMSPRPARKKRLDGMNDRGLETTLRRSNTVAARSPPRHPWGRRHLHHEAS
jgi:hypothetical protein